MLSTVRPMRALTLAAIALAALVLAAAASAAERQELPPSGRCAATGKGADAKRRMLLCLVNWARAANGIGAVSSSGLLGKAAHTKGNAIVRCGRFSHTPCGGDAVGPVRKTGYRYRLWGENLYWGSGPLASARSAVRGWLRSPGHRRALLDRRFREVGIAAIRWPGRGTVWVLELGRR